MAGYPTFYRVWDAKARAGEVSFASLGIGKVRCICRLASTRLGAGELGIMPHLLICPSDPIHAIRLEVFFYAGINYPIHSLFYLTLPPIFLRGQLHYTLLILNPRFSIFSLFFSPFLLSLALFGGFFSFPANLAPSINLEYAFMVRL